MHRRGQSLAEPFENATAVSPLWFLVTLDARSSIHAAAKRAAARLATGACCMWAMNLVRRLLAASAGWVCTPFLVVGSWHFPAASHPGFRPVTILAAFISSTRAVLRSVSILLAHLHANEPTPATHTLWTQSLTSMALCSFCNYSLSNGGLGASGLAVSAHIHFRG